MRHFGARLAGRLKLRMGVGEFRCRGGLIGVLILAHFGLEMDVTVAREDGGILDLECGRTHQARMPRWQRVPGNSRFQRQGYPIRGFALAVQAQRLGAGGRV